jgi:hypothetical protein
MKRLLLLPILLLPLVLMPGSISAKSGDAQPSAAANPAPVLTGTVLEVKDVTSYTYLLLRTSEGEIWAAVPSAQVKVGTEVRVVNYQVMSNFHSKSLNRSFDRIVFGSLADRGAQPPPPDMSAMHAGAPNAPKVIEVKVQKAKGSNAQTVAGVVTGSASLKDKPVTVRGQVVKFTPRVMGRNWMHLRDGTGSSADGSNDVLVATADTAKVGDIVLVKGTVRTDRDLGSGYSYKVLIEDAKVQK